VLNAPVTLAPAFAPKETGGSPEFPDYPFVHMPRSQTPVVSRQLAVSLPGLLPSGTCTPSALGSLAQTYLLSTIIHFSEFNDAACVLASPLLRTPRFRDRTSVRLPTGWLAFGRVGLESVSHPLGNFDMFQEVSPLSSHPEFSSARAAEGLDRLDVAAIAFKLHLRNAVKRHPADCVSGIGIGASADQGT
jgi:hypothetical protein